MPERPSDPVHAAQEERDPLDELATEFIQRARRGERPSIEEYAQKYPALALQIRKLFPVITKMEKLKIQEAEARREHATAGPLPLERLGEFRILRELGRGGMGIVYEAEQEQPRRIVALKVLPRQQAQNPKLLARFQREAQIAAGLQHKNIVPVYAVGAAGEFHYYAMQYVRGVGLDKIIAHLRDEAANKLTNISKGLVNLWIRQLREQQHLGPDELVHTHPSYFKTVARLGLQAAEGLAHVHAQGLLHRDIKPANLLVDPAGLLWIADFGLARPQQSADETSDKELTEAGALPGTLRYLAPERLRGKLDARGDVYSLGLTLYELLALRPAFPETQKLELLRCILQETPPPPSRFNAGVPPALELLVRQTIARDPSLRTQSARALAEGLTKLV
jgi:serine/threonine protein kinase